MDQDTLQDLRDIKAITEQMGQTTESMAARLDATDTLAGHNPWRHGRREQRGSGRAGIPGSIRGACQSREAAPHARRGRRADSETTGH